MTSLEQYSNPAPTAHDAWTSAAQSWMQTIEKVAEQWRLPFAPAASVDSTASVEQWYDFVQRLLDTNRQYAMNLAGATHAFSGAVREHLDSVGGAVRDQVKEVARTVKDQAEQARRAETEHDERVEAAEKEHARQDRQAARQQARTAREAARERYEGQPKAELSEELAKRELPKTGRVDDLVERLVEADTA